MKTLPLARSAGAGLLLTTILFMGVMPAQATPECVWPSGTISVGASCAQPQLMISQNPPYTVGSIVVIHGEGFEPGETVIVADRGGAVTFTAAANALGMFNIDWYLPDYSRTAGIMLRATGAVSNYETAATQIRQEAAHITAGVDGRLQGWHPGEELLITISGQPQPSAYAATDGTSGSFVDAKVPSGAKLEVTGKQSGGYYTRLGMGAGTGGRPPATVGPAPVEVAVEVPAEPVLEVPVELELEVAAEPIILPRVVDVPVPSRPQPQAAVSTVAQTETGSALIAGGSAAFLLATAASFLGIRRMRSKNTSQQ